MLTTTLLKPAEFTEEMKSISEVPAPLVERKHISPDFVNVREWKKAHDEYQQWVAIQKEFSVQSYRVAERRTEQTKAVDESLAQVCKLADERCKKLMGLTCGETPHETGSRDTDESNQLAEAIGDLKSILMSGNKNGGKKNGMTIFCCFLIVVLEKKPAADTVTVTKLWGKVKGIVPEVNEERSDKKIIP